MTYCPKCGISEFYEGLYKQSCINMKCEFFDPVASSTVAPQNENQFPYEWGWINLSEGDFINLGGEGMTCPGTGLHANSLSFTKEKMPDDPPYRSYRICSRWPFPNRRENAFFISEKDVKMAKPIIKCDIYGIVEIP